MLVKAGDRIDDRAQAISVLLADGHAMFREGLRASLEKVEGVAVAGLAGTVAEALERSFTTRPDVVILDAQLGEDRAVDFVGAARRGGYEGQILILTAGIGDREAVQLIQSGVAGILHKQHGTEELVATIRQIARGEFFLEPAYVASVFRSLDRTRAPKRPILTERDRTVLRFVLQGLTNRQIGGKLQISEGAVKASMRHVCEKLGVRTRTQLVRVALEQYRDQL